MDIIGVYFIGKRVIEHSRLVLTAGGILAVVAASAGFRSLADSQGIANSVLCRYLGCKTRLDMLGRERS